MAQYLKLGKKIAAGADYGITQIGFDMRKYEEVIGWLEGRGYEIPLVANVLPLSAARARYIRAHRLAGVTVADSFLALLEAEERSTPDRGAAKVIRRLALQIIGVRLLGYAGVQITGLHSVEKLDALYAQVDALSRVCADRQSWEAAWKETLALPDGRRASTAPPREPWYLGARRSARSRRRSNVKYRLMEKVHYLVFDKGLAFVLAPLLRNVKRHSLLDWCLERLERGIKAPLFGCETCGMCRLAATQYVCPETCPKGLANGACGGTAENLCEFGDRECIHSAKYRVARDMGVLTQLETMIIPPVPKAWRGTSSWPPYFRREAPKIHMVQSKRGRLRNRNGANSPIATSYCDEP
jgi:methylenetetrahydrofolate reductase (NADPH)